MQSANFNVYMLMILYVGCIEAKFLTSSCLVILESYGM